MTSFQNSIKFLQSIASELLSQATRVRDLIGDRHWLSDGHHKELLFISVLNRYLPSSYRASRGFVINPQSPTEVSKEQDILIIDTFSEPPLFEQGGLVIAFPKTVSAAISIKTKFELPEIIDSITGLNTVRVVSKNQAVSDRIWCGMFAFAGKAGGQDKLGSLAKKAEAAIKENAVPFLPPLVGINPITGPQYLASASGELIRVNFTPEPDAPCVDYFFSPDLAAAVFIHDLIGHLANLRGQPRTSFAEFLDLAWSAIHDIPT